MWCLIIVIIILLSMFILPGSPLKENYTQCYTCNDDYRMLDGGMVVSNPYIWPYSGTRDVDRIYQLGDVYKMPFGFSNEPLIHNNTPDHVILT